MLSFKFFILFLFIAIRKSDIVTAIPQKYTLSLNIEDTVFTGIVVIDLKVNGKIDKIELDSKVSITEVFVNEKKYMYQEKDDKLIIKGDFIEEKIVLRILFNGEIRNALNGIYRAGDMIATQFETTDARRMFPCFDSPDRKAVFEFIISTSPEFIVLSNTSVKEIKIIDDVKTTYFEETPIMSTYLLALIVGKLEAVEYTKDRIKVLTYQDLILEKEQTDEFRIRIYRGIHENGNDFEDSMFSLSATKTCLSWFENFFGIDYPLKKLDLIGVPDFQAGAMENWGLITFRESSLFVNKNSSPKAQLTVLNTVCHELAHQWYGNLVTMKWWDDLWLNEGFASWSAAVAISETSFPIIKKIDVEYIFSEELFKRDSMTSFIEEMNSGMSYDSMVSTHSISQNIKSDDEIDQIDPRIIYDKGKSILRMFEGYIGKEDFNSGIKQYISEFAYKNAESKDLFKQFINETIDTDFFEKWIKKDGYPLITVGLDNSISQRRFLMLGSRTKANEEDIVIVKSEKEEKVQEVIFTSTTIEEIIKQPIEIPEDNTIWKVPIKIDWLDGTFGDILLDKESMLIYPKTDLFKINSSTIGFYRVKYEDYKINFQLLKKEMDPKDKLGIINDLYSLTIAREYKIEIFLEASLLLLNENNYELFSGIVIKIRSFREITGKNKKFYKDFIGRFIRNPITTEVPFELNDQMRKAFILKELARNKFKEAKVLDRDEIPSLFKPAKHLHTILQQNNKDSFNQMLDIYKNSVVQDERYSALEALCQTKRFKRITKLISSIGKTIKLQDSSFFFFAITENKKFKHKIIRYVLKNHKEIITILKNDWKTIGVIFRIVFIGVPNRLYEDVKRFVESVDNPKFHRTKKNILELIEIRRMFREFNKDFDPSANFLYSSNEEDEIKGVLIKTNE